MSANFLIYLSIHVSVYKIPKCLFCVKSDKFKCITFNAHLSVFTGNLVIVIYPPTVDVVVILNSGPGRTLISIVNFGSVYIQKSRNYSFFL